jgi:hypothetical protein
MEQACHATGILFANRHSANVAEPSTVFAVLRQTGRS